MRGLRFFMVQESQSVKTELKSEIQVVGGKVTTLEKRMYAQDSEMKTFQARLTAVETGRAQCTTGGVINSLFSGCVCTGADRRYQCALK